MADELDIKIREDIIKIKEFYFKILEEIKLDKTIRFFSDQNYKIWSEIEKLKNPRDVKKSNSKIENLIFEIGVNLLTGWLVQGIATHVIGRAADRMLGYQKKDIVTIDKFIGLPADIKGRYGTTAYQIQLGHLIPKNRQRFNEFHKRLISPEKYNRQETLGGIAVPIMSDMLAAVNFQVASNIQKTKNSQVRIDQYYGDDFNNNSLLTFVDTIDKTIKPLIDEFWTDVETYLLLQPKNSAPVTTFHSTLLEKRRYSLKVGNGIKKQFNDAFRTTILYSLAGEFVFYEQYRMLTPNFEGKQRWPFRFRIKERYDRITEMGSIYGINFSRIIKSLKGAKELSLPLDTKNGNINKANINDEWAKRNWGLKKTDYEDQKEHTYYFNIFGVYIDITVNKKKIAYLGFLVEELIVIKGKEWNRFPMIILLEKAMPKKIEAIGELENDKFKFIIFGDDEGKAKANTQLLLKTINYKKDNLEIYAYQKDQPGAIISFM